MTTLLPTTRSRVARMLCAGCACLAVAALSGCRGDRSDNPPRQILPDMDDSPKWKPQSESAFFADGRTMRPAVEGAVAFGRFDFDPVAFEAKYGHEDWATPLIDSRKDLLREDDAFYRGVDAQGDFLNTIPPSVEVTRDLILRGQSRFNIYCSACHGYLGDGRGMVGDRWVARPPSYHQDKYRDSAQRTGKDGYIFDVARNGMFDAMGAQKMPGYAHALSERDAWAVVAYIRALQASRTTIDSDQVPQDVRQDLLTQRDADAPDVPTPPESNGGGP